MLNDEHYRGTMEQVLFSFYEIDSFNENDYDSSEEADKAFEEAINTAILEKGFYHFTDKDKDLLLDYAPKLFAPQYSKKDSYQIDLKPKYTDKELYEMMSELAEYVGSYRYDKTHNTKSKELYKPRQEKKSAKDREVSLVNHINAILDLIGRVDKQGDDNQNALREQLVEARNTPAEYVKPVGIKTIKVTKDQIRQYLYSLKLVGKKDTIDKFVSEIK